MSMVYILIFISWSGNGAAQATAPIASQLGEFYTKDRCEEAAARIRKYVNQGVYGASVECFMK
jgi:hypothetical protein